MTTVTKLSNPLNLSPTAHCLAHKTIFLHYLCIIYNYSDSKYIVIFYIILLKLFYKLTKVYSRSVDHRKLCVGVKRNTFLQTSKSHSAGTGMHARSARKLRTKMHVGTSCFAAVYFAFSFVVVKPIQSKQVEVSVPSYLYIPTSIDSIVKGLETAHVRPSSCYELSQFRAPEKERTRMTKRSMKKTLAVGPMQGRIQGGAMGALAPPPSRKWAGLQCAHAQRHVITIGLYTLNRCFWRVFRAATDQGRI